VGVYVYVCFYVYLCVFLCVCVCLCACVPCGVTGWPQVCGCVYVCALVHVHENICTLQVLAGFISECACFSKPRIPIPTLK